MMKKVFKVCLIASLLMATTSAFAQDEEKPEFPHYSFWSNWYLGGSLDFDWQHPMGSLTGDGAGLGKTTNIGIDVFAMKKLSHMFDLRVRLGLPCFIPAAEKVDVDGTDYVMANHGTFTTDFLWSINHAIEGWNPDRKWSIYLYMGAGFGLNFNKIYRNSIIKIGAEGSVHPNFQYGFFGVAMTGGLGYSVAFGEHHNLFIEYGMDWDMDLPMPSEDLHHTNSILRLGYFYSFGVTEEDQALIDQKAMLTRSNFNALNSQINNLERQVANGKNNEKKLENRIADLEDQLAQALANAGKGNGAAADSLQAVIDQIKADQLTFYAMPFSVQYDVDEWKVTDEEEAKVKAVARVLKDNPDVKVMVVGFADYTGSDNYNMKLSEKRAKEVKRLLVKRYGIAEDRIQTEYKGKSVAFGDIQYALNRRVSFYRVIE